jgi:DNA polymerase-3 subunit delta
LASLSFDALHRALKQGDVAPVYLLVGPEDLLKDEALDLILERALDPSLRDFNLDQRTAASLDPEGLEALLDTLPMLAERRVVVLRDVDAWQARSRARTALLAWLARPAASTVLVLTQGAGEPDPDKELAARATVVRCDVLPPDRAAKWSMREAGRLGVTLDPDAAAHLVKVVGAELAFLRAELAKVSALPEGTVVTPELLADLVGVRHGETPLDWREALLDDDTGRAARLLDPVLAQSNVSGVRLVTLLGTALLGVRVARAELDRGVRGRALEDAAFRAMQRLRLYGVGDWKVEARLWARWAERWPADRLRAALAAALEADQALKGTTLRNERTVLLDLILQLGASAPSRAA